jgi:hypothetical protein
MASVAFGQVNPVLIINGSSATSEPSTTSSITTNLQNKVIAAGGTPTVVDTPPGSITGYKQVWDIRFANSSPLTGSVITQYVDYLAGGGVLFVMGENDGFPTRNTSVISLVAAAGGGSISFLTPNSLQTVLAPFTGPNAVSTITYNAPGGAGGATPGTGAFMTRDSSNNGTGIVWNKNTMSNATNGVLSVVFDVNWMQDTADTNSQNFLRNLINFNSIQSGVGGTATGVPTLTDSGLLGLSMLLMIFGASRLRLGQSA